MKIRKHPHGGCYTTLTIKGNKKFIYGSDPEEVEKKYTEMKYKYHQGHNVNDSPTMESYMTTWYNAFKKGQGAIKTQKMYQNCINVHINPVLGNKRVKDVTGTQIQTFLNKINGSKSLVHKIRITLNQIFKQAIADRLITFNPVTNTKIIAQDKPKRAYLTPIQRQLLLQILEKDRFYPVIITILYTGTRMGEAIALMQSDINNDNISIKRAVEFENAKPKLKTTKTERGIRDIPMPSVLSDYLESYQSKNQKGLYLFPGHTGGLMGETEITRLWRKAKKKIDKYFDDNPNMGEHKFNLTFRLLRHTYCTGLFDAGIDEVSAAEIMGHDVNIMREVYTHISDERKQKTVIKLENLYKESPDNDNELKEVN